MSDNLVIHGPPLLTPISDESVGRQIYDSLNKCAEDKIAYVDAHNGRQMSYKEFFQTSCQLAKSLQNCGYKIDDVISICSENTINFFIAVAAALYLGIPVAPLNHMYTERELLHIAGITKPQIIFCTKNTVNVIQKLKNTAHYIERIIILDLNDKVPGYDNIAEFINKYCENNFSIAMFNPIRINSDNTAFIPCSSGTTGLPKGVMVTHDNISMRINQLTDPRISIPTPVILGILPFFHAYGFIISVGALIQNSIVVVMKRFEEDLFLKSIEQHKISSLYLVPPIMHFLAKNPKVKKYNLSSVKEITSGAAPLSMEIEAIIAKRLPTIEVIRQGYGLTEATLGVTFMPIGHNKSGSSGKLVPGISCIIRDPETNLRLGYNKIGELCFKGRLITKGYYGNKKATDLTYSKDGWLYTGDVGYYDEEHYFYVVDRLKELIKYKGFQVPPAELEGILIKHSEIKDAAVIGKPDEEAGELPTAFIVREANSSITEQQIKAYVAKNVSRQKQLRGDVYFVHEIPKNPSGKILRRILRDRISKQVSKL